MLSYEMRLRMKVTKDMLFSQINAERIAGKVDPVMAMDQICRRDQLARFLRCGFEINVLIERPGAVCGRIVIN